MSFASTSSLTSQKSTFAAVLFLGVAVVPYLTFAQYGVSPSQTGQFFDDLRGRASSQAAAGVKSGEGTYDYEKGAYVGGADQGSGTDTYFDASSDIGRPSTSAGTATYSQLRAGDYTQYASPYPSQTSFFAPTYTSDPFLGGKRNLKLGPVNVGFGATSLIEYNDNITRASGLKDANGVIAEPISDVIASAFLNIDARYQVTETNALTLSTAIGFDHYFDHPEVSPYGGDFTVNVLPGSTLTFDGKLGPVYFVLFDRISMRPAVQNDFALNSAEIFGVFQNDIGFGATWAINSSLNLSLNYIHSNAIALEEQSAKYDRTMDSIQSSLAWSPTGAWTLGLEGGLTFVKYPKHYNNDGRLANAGAFFATPIGKSTFLRVAGGVQRFSFDEPAAGPSNADIAAKQGVITNLDTEIANAKDTTQALPIGVTDRAGYVKTLEGQRDTAVTNLNTAQSTFTTAYNQNTHDASDLDDYYTNITLSNRLTSRISHALSFGHESALNTTSNFITADYVSYGVGVIAWHGSRLALSGYYENATESGGQAASVVDDASATGGKKVDQSLLKEDIEQYGFDAYLSHQLSPRMRMGVGYHYGIADSNKDGRDYTQNAFNVDLNLTLTQKLNMSLGYRFYTTEADLASLGFDQNRFVMSMNYNF
jgi:hypothetical protein